MEATTVCAHCGKKSDGRPLVCEGCGEDPRVQGRYRLEGELGRGGSGVTWRARREPGGEPVCLKELRWASMGSLDDERRFAREGQLLEALDHPAIPKHHGAFAWGEGRSHALFIAQELVVGDNLEVERRSRGYTMKETLAAGAELADVLVYLHERHPPVVHRDIKPSNVMRRVDGQLVLIDFGAARVSGLGNSQVSVAGTFGYMAPEQIRGEAGPAVDIYGLGMTLAVLSAGGDPEDLLDANNRPDFARIANLRGDLRQLFEVMCAVDPARRPSAAEVARRCREMMRGPRSVQEPRAASRPASPAPARKKSGAGLVIVVVAVLVVGGIFASTLTMVGDLMKEVPIQQVAPAVALASVPIEAAPDPIVAAIPAPVPAEPVASSDPLPQAVEGCAVLAKESSCDMLVDATRTMRERVVALPGWPAPLIGGCTRGVASACYNTAIIYSQGIGVPESRIETRKYFAKACDLGNTESCGSYGNMLIKGDGGAIDWKAALPVVTKACNAGDNQSCINVGVIYASEHGEAGALSDRPKALSVFEGLCAKGEHVACQNLEGMVGQTWGLPAGGQGRIDALTRLCNARVGTACLRLGDAYARGTGIKKDAAKALEVYTRGCDVGSQAACKKMK